MEVFAVLASGQARSIGTSNARHGLYHSKYAWAGTPPFNASSGLRKDAYAHDSKILLPSLAWAQVHSLRQEETTHSSFCVSRRVWPRHHRNKHDGKHHFGPRRMAHDLDGFSIQHLAKKLRLYGTSSMGH